ncbi:NRPS-like enzyme [Aspergillus luchuensis]|uniref:NRPS-like enzyme n=2 Tax=Aspergillus kawachii TaxID=1069201 RepID=A0A146F5G9_ASPKA|nr:NRPS-like enzyme [Aspergillus luchuensis IFO 4308]GAT21338.1 NRPS-like enzyme [Aspergillus luchuensis]
MERVLAQHAQEHPDAMAVLDGHQALTYGQLLARATCLADRLQLKEKVEAEEPVGILLSPGLSQVVAQVAVRLVGATCVPLEPKQPPKRICELLRDVAVRRVIVEDLCTERYEGFDLHPMEHLEPALFRHDNHLITQKDCPQKEDGRSHILFTSGSTGKPKPVQIQTSSILHLAMENNMTPLSHTDRVTAFNNPGFDLSLFEIWATLIARATIVVLPKGVATDASRLLAFLTETRASVMIIPTALFNVIASTAPNAFRALRHVITAGEAANPRALRSVLEKEPPENLWNGYGPTEGTTLTTLYRVTLPDCLEDRISIGQPIGKAIVYLLDDNLEPIEESGIHGEICIGGPGKSAGYLHRRRENEERFVQILNPHRYTKGTGITDSTTDSGSSIVELYRTGDIGQWRRDKPGFLDYIGRRDTQVKHQGFLVELEEISRIMESSPLVESCVVIQRPPLSVLHSSILIAYIIPSGGNKQGQHAILRFAQATLPSYMIPERFELVTTFPLTANGKVDRQALLDSYAQGPRKGEAGRKQRVVNDTSTSPNDTDTRSVLAKIWEELLQVSHPTPEQDSFLLGASSIQAAALIALIQHRLERLITMDELHAHARFSSMCDLLDTGQAPGEDRYKNAPDHTSIWANDVDIVDDIPLAPDWESAAEGRAFLTGATGFVGAHILRRLIERSGVKQVACLARARDGQSAAARVRKAMEKYDLFPEPLELSQKILVLEGDIGDEKLGLGPTQFNWLVDWASVIFHVAAKVNFCESYQEHHRANVIGTRNVLNAAALGRRKAFHYMSSIDVFGPSGMILGTRSIPEDSPLINHLPALRYDLGYGQSQWTAEAMVRRMQGKGLPIAIYRPGFIIGDSVTGASNPDDFITRWIVGCMEMGSFPRIVDMRFEYCTIDFVCSSVLQIASENKNLGQAYHILSPDRTKSLTVEDTITLLHEVGYPVRMIDYSDWVKQAVKSGTSEGALAPLMPVLQERVLGELTRWECAQFSPVYECTNTVRALAGCPEAQYKPFTIDVLRRSMAFWKRKGFYDV